MPVTKSIRFAVVIDETRVLSGTKHATRHPMLYNQQLNKILEKLKLNRSL